MENTRAERAKRLADVHAQARIMAGKSQEYMALELGVSKKTVQNWEKAVSSPSLFQSLEWFRVLNANAFRAYFEIIFPERVYATRDESTDEEVNAEFEKLCDVLTINDKKALLFIFHGKHGSSAHSILQLCLSHLHLPLSMRVTLADMIYSTYELNREANTLVCPNDIKPDMVALENARKQARIAVINNEYGYSLTEKEE